MSGGTPIFYLANTLLTLAKRPLAVARPGDRADVLRLVGHILDRIGVRHRREGGRLIVGKVGATVATERRLGVILVRMDGPADSPKWQLVVQIIRKQVRARAWRDLPPAGGAGPASGRAA